MEHHLPRTSRTPTTPQLKHKAPPRFLSHRTSISCSTVNSTLLGRCCFSKHTQTIAAVRRAFRQRLAIPFHKVSRIHSASSFFRKKRSLTARCSFSRLYRTRRSLVVRRAGLVPPQLP